MEAFNGRQQVLSLADLNKRTRLPKSTLHRLVDQLCQVGWLERARGGYRVGLRMFELGTLAVEENRLHDAAFPHLQALASCTGLAAQLAILDRAEVVYLERIVMGPIRLPTRRGGRKPAYCTALGKAIAAYDDEATNAVISAPMPRQTEHDHRAGCPVDRTRTGPRIRRGVRPRRGLRRAGMRGRADPQLRARDRRRLGHRADRPDALGRGGRGGAQHGGSDLERRPRPPGPGAVRRLRPGPAVSRRS
jgi:DNA-binding IclR family transcriptional regulator